MELSYKDTEFQNFYESYASGSISGKEYREQKTIQNHISV